MSSPEISTASLSPAEISVAETPLTPSNLSVSDGMHSALACAYCTETAIGPVCTIYCRGANHGYDYCFDDRNLRGLDLPERRYVRYCGSYRDRTAPARSPTPGPSRLGPISYSYFISDMPRGQPSAVWAVERVPVNLKLVQVGGEP